MKYQELEINFKDDFEPVAIFECGQCFRWNKCLDNSYTGVIKNGVLNVKKEKQKILFKGVLNVDINEVVNKYFDLDRSYANTRKQLAKIDNHVKQSTEFAKGVRILNQDLFETILSFIISANNNIPRIKGIIEKMSTKYGKKVEFEGKEYFLFPTAKELANVKIEEYRALGLGFRDIRLLETVSMINNGFELKKLYDMPTNKVRDTLLTLSGVGPKVADCILLFSDLKRFDVFPIDVWVRRVMNDLYIKKEDEKKVSKKEIMDIANNKFGNIAGLAQQYLFYWKRSSLN